MNQIKNELFVEGKFLVILLLGWNILDTKRTVGGLFG